MQLPAYEHMLFLTKLNPRLLSPRRVILRPKSTWYMERVRAPEPMDIRLTDTESEICTLLDGCTKWMKEERGIETSCRIAGGWVRDKVCLNSGVIACRISVRLNSVFHSSSVFRAMTSTSRSQT